MKHLSSMPLHHFSEKAYLNYAMYVIKDRALPHLGDGLKPVQRRIIYAMSELGLKSGAKFKKAARTVGDVLGKFHPHGDTACYEAMVLMAQAFSFRYPLIEGQGNWGSTDDPKSFAAMRYTEAKLSNFASLLLDELEQGSIDWGDNFDGSLKEPCMLPACLPFILLNGATGIAVGMATDIPPHNMIEMVNACVYLLDHPEADLMDILKWIKGPDFPSGGELITARDDLIKLYAKGVGSLRLRACYEVEKQKIIITELPYQTSGSKILTQIAEQIQKKELPMIADFRDESDHEYPIRLVISVQPAYHDLHGLMEHLFVKTDLERSYRVNFNMLNEEGSPEVLPLLSLLKKWLKFRIKTVRRRYVHRLAMLCQRLQVLDGFLIAYDHLEAVIACIREQDDPKASLMKAFSLDEIQVEAILSLKLRQLAKLAQQKICQEKAKLLEEKAHIDLLLENEHMLKKQVRMELKANAKKYGDTRRTNCVERSAAKTLLPKTSPSKPISFILSKKGWIRMLSGHDIDPLSAKYKVGDSFYQMVQGYSNQVLICADNKGRSYSLSTSALSVGKEKGEPLNKYLKLPLGASFIGLMLGKWDQSCVWVAEHGYGFMNTLHDVFTKNQKGKAIVSLTSEQKILAPILVSEDEKEKQYIALLTNQGDLLIYPVAELAVRSKGKGSKLIAWSPDKEQVETPKVIAALVFNQSDHLLIIGHKKTLKLQGKKRLAYKGYRGSKGFALPKRLHAYQLAVEKR